MAGRPAQTEGRGLVLFFEGTGQGVEGSFTNVTRLKELCREDARQLLHLESGPGTHFGAYLAGRIHGADWRGIFRRSRRWFEAHYATYDRVYLFGFSRGALLARHFAAWLDKQGIATAFLGVWDTVDATPGLEVSEVCPLGVKAARHAVARDEARRFFDLVPLKGHPQAAARQVAELVFPGSHSDVGGLYTDNHLVADVSLAWMVSGARRAGLRLNSGVRLGQRCEAAAVRLHPSHALISNLFGAFKAVPRQLKGIRRHRLCREVAGERED